VAVFQPASATTLHLNSGSICCGIVSEEGKKEIQANIGIIAHGSWDTSSLPTQHHHPAKESTLLGFKAYFANSSLPDDLMPLLTFRGGYGGMVMGAKSRLSVSCCICRDVLGRLRSQAKVKDAGTVIQEYLTGSCRGALEVLAGSQRIGSWLAAGPIRPGIRTLAGNRLFHVGNAAGEAHPIVAEGISMALQGAWLLADYLIQHRRSCGMNNWRRCEEAYDQNWRRCFARRIGTAKLLASWSQSQALVEISVPLIRWLPRVLTWGAVLSGKSFATIKPRLCKARRLLHSEST
jgi:flavin-dependent dehydrogenase